MGRCYRKVHLGGASRLCRLSFWWPPSSRPTVSRVLGSYTVSTRWDRNPPHWWWLLHADQLRGRISNSSWVLVIIGWGCSDSAKWRRFLPTSGAGAWWGFFRKGTGCWTDTSEFSCQPSSSSSSLPPWSKCCTCSSFTPFSSTLR